MGLAAHGTPGERARALWQGDKERAPLRVRIAVRMPERCGRYVCLRRPGAARTRLRAQALKNPFFLLPAFLAKNRQSWVEYAQF